MKCIRFLIAMFAGVGLLASAVEAQDKNFCEAMNIRFPGSTV